MKPKTEFYTLAPNVHQRRYFFEGIEDKTIRIAMLSDIHWDNPKCDWDLLKKHLDYCKENDIRIHINGDFFCLMQGRYDGRRVKGDIRPEHNTAKYLQDLIYHAVEWWSPYANMIDVIGYGNHETGIIKHCEVDPLQWFVNDLNRVNGTSVQKGGYGGWYLISMHQNKSKKKYSTYKIKYFHGSGGGGVVTRGEINLTRATSMYGNFDCFTMGHIHENKESWITKEILTRMNKIELKDVLLMNTGTYKEEYGDGSKGWHVQRGAPPKPVGGRILELKVTGGTDSSKITAKSYRF